MQYIDHLQGNVESGTFLLLHPIHNSNAMRMVKVAGNELSTQQDKHQLSVMSYRAFEYHGRRSNTSADLWCYMIRVEPTGDIVTINTAEIHDICFVFSAQQIEREGMKIQGRKDCFMTHDSNHQAFPNMNYNQLSYAEQIWKDMAVVRKYIRVLIRNKKDMTTIENEVTQPLIIAPNTWQYMVRQVQNEAGIKYSIDCLQSYRDNKTAPDDVHSKRKRQKGMYEKLSFRGLGGRSCLLQLFGEAAIHHVFTHDNHIYNRGDELQENTWVYSVDKMNMVYRNQKLYVHLLHQTYCYHTLHNNQLAICTCALLDRYLKQQPPGGDEHNFWHISHYNATDSDTI